MIVRSRAPAQPAWIAASLGSLYLSENLRGRPSSRLPRIHKAGSRLRNPAPLRSRSLGQDIVRPLSTRDRSPRSPPRSELKSLHLRHGPPEDGKTPPAELFRCFRRLFWIWLRHRLRLPVLRSFLRSVAPTRPGFCS